MIHVMGTSPCHTIEATPKQSRYSQFTIAQFMRDRRITMAKRMRRNIFKLGLLAGLSHWNANMHQRSVTFYRRKHKLAVPIPPRTRAKLLAPVFTLALVFPSRTSYMESVTTFRSNASIRLFPSKGFKCRSIRPLSIVSVVLLFSLPLDNI